MIKHLLASFLVLFYTYSKSMCINRQTARPPPPPIYNISHLQLSSWSRTYIVWMSILIATYRLPRKYRINKIKFIYTPHLFIRPVAPAPASTDTYLFLHRVLRNRIYNLQITTQCSSRKLLQKSARKQIVYQTKKPNHLLIK